MPQPKRLRPRLAAATLALLIGLPLVACDATTEPEGRDDVTLTFGVFGPPAEIDAFQAMVDTFNMASDSTTVELRSWSSADELMAAVRAGGAERPDLFLTPRADLDALVDEGINAPLFELLEARNVNTGDEFNHDALIAFSEDDDLQCVPYAIDPMVMYLNTDLVDFDAMQERDLPVPGDPLEGWTFEEFRAAAQFASRRGSTRGIGVQPTLDAIAPYLLSGGGAVFDDADNPTSTALSSDGSIDALTTALSLLRDPALTLTTEQLAEASPLTWFERGKLAMVQGYRSLVPELREVEGLNFDVMPMPALGDPATVGSMTGICIAAGEQAERAADFLVYALAKESLGIVTRAGYMVPATVAVARSDAFLQPGREPESAGAFNVAVDSLRLIPRLNDDALEDAVEPGLTEMLEAPIVVDLDALTAQIDEASRSVLDPDYVAETPSSDPS